MWRTIGLWAALLPVAGLPVAAADDDVRAWLETTLGREHTLNYEGTFVYVEGGRLDAMRIVHGRGEAGEWQRLVSLSGPRREVVVTNQDLTCSLPRSQFAVRGKHSFAGLPLTITRDLARLDTRYRFVLAGEDRVAGLQARMIAIEPRDTMRFGYRLWIEPQTGMVVRSVLVDEQGAALEQLMFTELHFLDAAPAAPAETAQTHEEGAAAEQLNEVAGGERHWSAIRLPPGFEEIRYNRFARKGGTHATDHVVYSDGLATISVFVESLDGVEPMLGHARIGAMNAFGRVSDGHQIVVVGEVPRDTVEMVAASIGSKFQSAGGKP